MKFFNIALLFFLTAAAVASDIAMPVLYGHRGDQEMGLQNTMSAFRGAWQNNCRGVELDVRQTKDGKLICFHDADFSKLAGDKRKVANLTYDEIKKIDISCFKHPMFKDEHPPLLEEVFAEMPKGFNLHIEVKANSVDGDFPQRLRELMQKYRVASEQITVVSFDEDVLRNLNRKTPGIQNMWIVGLRCCRNLGMGKGDDITKVEDKLIAKLKDIGCTGVSFAAGDSRIKFDRRFTDKLKKSGLQYSFWLVNDLWQLRRLAEYGAETVLSDRPVSLQYAWEKRFGKK